MKVYKTLVKDKQTGEILFIESECNSKKDFMAEVRSNGYSVHGMGWVATKECHDWNMDNVNLEFKDDFVNDREYNRRKKEGML